LHLNAPGVKLVASTFTSTFTDHAIEGLDQVRRII
jgi:hypothetical protein